MNRVVTADQAPGPALRQVGSVWLSMAAPPQGRRAGCHGRLGASILHAGAGLLRTDTAVVASMYTTTAPICTWELTLYWTAVQTAYQGWCPVSVYKQPSL